MHPLHGRFWLSSIQRPPKFLVLPPRLHWSYTTLSSDVSIVGRRTSDEMVRYLTIRKKYAEMIFDGTKKYEARPLSCRPLRDVQSGEKIHFHYYREWKLRCDIVEVHKFDSVTDMILNIGAGNLIPGKKTLEDVLAPWL